MKRPTEGTRPNRRLSTTSTPTRQGDDCADLVVDDRADPDADRAPQRHAGEPPKGEEQDVAAGEHDRDATPVEDYVADRLADRLAEDPNREVLAVGVRTFACESDKRADDDLGGQDV